MSNHADKNQYDYWRKNLKIMYVLLVIWAVVSFAFGIWLRPLLDVISFGGVGLGFWFAQQGSILFFLAIVCAYAFLMHRVDREFGLEE